MQCDKGRTEWRQVMGKGAGEGFQSRWHSDEA